MKEQEDISAKKIKLDMSPTPWTLSDVIQEPYTLRNDFDLIAATTAVNNTYGKGYDPEQMHMVIISLEWALKLLDNNGFGNAEDLPYALAQLSLKKARI